MSKAITPADTEICFCKHIAITHHYRGKNRNKGRCLAVNCDCNRFTYEDGTEPPLDELELNPRTYTPPPTPVNPLEEEINMATHMWITNDNGIKESLCRDPKAQPADKTNPLHKKAPICRQCFLIQSDVLNKKIARLEKEVAKLTN